MSRIRMLAVSAAALGAVFVGYSEASAFSFPSTFLLSQTGSPSGTPGGSAGGSGAPSDAARSGSSAGPAGGSAMPRATPPQPSVSPPAAPGSSRSSSSMGVPAQCAGFQNDAAQLQECFDRFYRDGRR